MAEQNARLIGCEIVNVPRQLQPVEAKQEWLPEAVREIVGPEDEPHWQRTAQQLTERMEDFRRRLVALIAAKCKASHCEWEAGLSTSPEPRDYVIIARDVLERAWPAFSGTTPEGEQFVADALEEAMSEGRILKWKTIAEELFDQLTAT
jgi:hypothetical protein